MRLHPLVHVAGSLAAYFALGLALLRAQPSPPPQDHVAAIGASPLRAALTGDFSPGSTFTMEGWFYLQTYSRGGWLMGKELATSPATTGDPFVSFGLYLSPGDGSRLEFASSNGATGSYRVITSPAALPLSTWVHCAIVVDGLATRLLVNGAVVVTGSSPGVPPARSGVAFGVGRPHLGDGTPTYSPFPGLARQLRFWNVARTAVQIAASLGEIIPADRTGLVAVWPLDESAGLSARDLSGNNRPLVAINGPIVGVGSAITAAGPFFSATTTPVAAGLLTHANPKGLPIDFDGDGDLDLLVMQGFGPATFPEVRTPIRAFRFGNGAYADVTAAVLGNATAAAPARTIVGDFTGDGRPDVVIADVGVDAPPFPGGQSLILVQTSDGRLVDETAARLPRRLAFTHDIAAADIDGDGDLDLYLGNLSGGDSGPRFYLNDGRGFFTEAVDRLPSDIANRVSAATFASCNLIDLNRDGRPDLLLGGSDTSANEILLNDGTGRFARPPRALLPPKLFGNTGATLTAVDADFNGDGLKDLLLVTGGGEEMLPILGRVVGYAIPGMQLLVGRADGTFADATATAGFFFGANEKSVILPYVVDLDGDGRPDLVAQVATRSDPVLRLWLNRGDATFVDITDTFSRSPIGIVAHAADIDRDGLVDLVTATSAGVVFHRAVKRPTAGRLANLSVRSAAGTGDATLIAGFALDGAGTEPLIVRAVGPSLGAFGLSGTLADPLVEIAPLGVARLAVNDDWGGTSALKNAFTGVGAFPLSPDTSKDAALVFSPAAGAYTARVTGANNGTGMALVEVYDTATGNTPRLTNLSARTLVGTGADALFAGFVVNGTLPKRLLIRAAGPTLAGFGVGGTLADPVLTLRRLGADTIVATNDDWSGTAALKAAFASVGAFAFAADASRDSALVLELPPGAYTATVTGKNNTTGIALVEVYELP